MVMAHQGSEIEYKNYYCTRPHAKVLTKLLGREVQWIDDVCGPAAREAIKNLKDGEILLLTFYVSGTAPKGKYDIRISYNTGDIFDGDWNDLAVTVNNGTVGIS